jgi:hypothetical protein
MQKKFFLTAILFFLLAYLVLYFSPGIVESLKAFLNDSDFLEPFTIFQVILDKNSSPDYEFGAYIPIFDLLVGFIFWLTTQNIQLTFTFYAIYQPILLTACMLYLAYCLVGKNWKIFGWIVLFSALPILIFSTGHFKTLYYLFLWHIHVSTVGAGFVLLGATILYVTRQPQDRKIFTPSLIFIAIFTLLAVVCDPGFLAQFIVPIISVLILMVVIRLIPIRRAIYTSLALLYATAGGLAMYEFPRLWGNDRILLYGSIVRPAYYQIFDNLPLFTRYIWDMLEQQYWLVIIWAVFFILCVTSAWSIIRHGRFSNPCAVRTRMLIILVFLPVQMVISILATLTTSDPAIRYFLSSIYMPFFYGWPILLILKPGWLSWLNGQKLLVMGYSFVAAILIVIGINFSGTLSSPLPDLTNYYPEFTACLDENAARLHLHRGISHYWQARKNTYLSKTGLIISQVYPDLTPMLILNNSDIYRGEFDFVIIDNHPEQKGWGWIERDVVLSRFGQPATSFTCGQSDILIYNRESDKAFRDQFAQYLLKQTRKP